MTEEELKAEAQRIMTAVKAESGKIMSGPNWRQYAVLALVLIILVYLLWSMFHKKPEPTKVFTAAIPAVNAPKVAGPALQQPIRIIEKHYIQEKFPEYHGADDPKDQVVDTIKVPVSDNGATVISKVDTATGEVTSQIEQKAAPWFQFEDKNYLGAAYRLTSNGGKSVPFWYKRDIAQIKGVFIQIEAGGKIPLDATDKVEAHIQAGAEYRWRGLFPWSD